MRAILATFWYVFTHQHEMVWNVFYYPYFFRGKISYCYQGECADYPAFPFYLVVVGVDLLVFFLLARFFSQVSPSSDKLIDHTSEGRQ